MRSRVRDARLANGDDAIDIDTSFHLPLAARPIDFDTIHANCMSKSEMQPEIVLRQVAATAAHFVDLRSAARREAHARANGAPVGPDSFELENDPVPRRLVSGLQQRG